MQLRTILLGLLLIGYSSNSSAQFSTGEDLFLAQNACYSNDDIAKCNAVIEFIKVVTSTAMVSHENKPFCFPDRVYLGTMDTIVEKYLKENRAALDDSAPEVVIDALKQAYPCEDK